MNAHDVIEAHVREVMRSLPRAERNDIGLELRELLGEMLAARAERAGGPADGAMALAMLREFGAPAEVAARYRSSGMVIIPAEQTRRFALWSLLGIALQWALTLPAVFQGQPIVAWWFGWGLGALWWPGFLVMMALAAAWVRSWGLSRPAWRPRPVDGAPVSRGLVAFTLACMLIGMVLVLSLPWLGPRLPAPLAQVFAFDPGFLHTRAWPVLPLYLEVALVRVLVLYAGRWTPGLRRVDLASSILWVGMLAWWLVGDAIFVAPASDAGARFGLVLVLVFVIVELVLTFNRWRMRIRAPGANA